MARRLGWSLCIAGGLSLGCTMGPDYERPPVMMPEKWRMDAKADATIANVPWWELFKDEQLAALIKAALEENRDLKIAIERIEEARATYGISKADLYPHLSANVTGGGLNPSNGSLTHPPDTDETADGDSDTKAYANLNLGFSWELDFFGRVRRANEAEQALMLASEEGRRAVAIALVSDVATAYVDLRGLDRRLAVALDTVESRKQSVDLGRTRFEGRVTPGFDWRQAEAELRNI